MVPMLHFLAARQLTSCINHDTVARLAQVPRLLSEPALTREEAKNWSVYVQLVDNCYAIIGSELLPPQSAELEP